MVKCAKGLNFYLKKYLISVSSKKYLQEMRCGLSFYILLTIRWSIEGGWDVAVVIHTAYTRNNIIERYLEKHESVLA